jgi:predicted HTH transcriptional regulator
LSAGEGLNVEFKPFVDPDSKKPQGGAKSKLDEIAITAVAFANTEGGHIYLGVSDDCEVAGIEAKVCEWAKESSTDSVIGRYLGALKSRIKSVVAGELAFEASHVWLDGALIAVIHVLAADRRPIAMRQDHYLYARSGASNRKVPPDQWRIVLEPSDERLAL